METCPPPHPDRDRFGARPPMGRAGSAGVIARLKRSWAQDCDAWRRQDLPRRQFLAIRVVTRADEEDRKEIPGIQDGFRGRADSRRDLLRARGTGGAQPIDKTHLTLL